MDPANAHPTEFRPPALDDLLHLCRQFNQLQARYIVVGGLAVIQRGFTRATEDIDLLVDGELESQSRVKSASEVLPDWAVVRVANEVVENLMHFTCDIGYSEASQDIQNLAIQGVPIPFAPPRVLPCTKQTHRKNTFWHSSASMN